MEIENTLKWIAETVYGLPNYEPKYKPNMPVSIMRTSSKGSIDTNVI